MAEADHLSAKQLASLLRVDRLTVVRLIHAGRLAGQQVGHQYQISRHAAAAYFRDNTFTPDGQEPTPVTAETLPQTISLDEVAEKTGLPLWWLKRGCQRRQLEYIKAGRARRMTDDQIRAAIAKATVRTVDTDEVQTELARRSRRRHTAAAAAA